MRSVENQECRKCGVWKMQITKYEGYKVRSTQERGYDSIVFGYRFASETSLPF